MLQEVNAHDHYVLLSHKIPEVSLQWKIPVAHR